MRQFTVVVLLFCILLPGCLLFPGCASIYRPINPAGLTRMTPEVGDGIAYSYQYGVLGASRNKKLAKKEMKKGIRVIGVQFQNNTGRTINFRNDVRVYMGDRLVSPLETGTIRHQIKQIAPIYLLYALGVGNLTICEDNGDCTTYRIPVGLLIGLINLAVAASANASWMDELKRNNLIDREIRDGETVSGLIGLQSDILGPIKMKVITE